MVADVFWAVGWHVGGVFRGCVDFVLGERSCWMGFRGWYVIVVWVWRLNFAEDDMEEEERGEGLRSGPELHGYMAVTEPNRTN